VVVVSQVEITKGQLISLTANHGPLSSEAGGSLNFELEAPDLVLYLDPMPYWIRALFEGETIVDAYEPLLLHESGRLPVYYFREEEVNRDLLESSETRSEPKGIAEYWTVRVGERAAPDAALSYSLPIEGAALLQGLLTLDWDEMDEMVLRGRAALRPPARSVQPNRHVQDEPASAHLARRRAARRDQACDGALRDGTAPPRYYIPEEDVRTELLVQSSNRSRCAYKGSASYWSVQIGGRLVEDLVWAYRDPKHDAEEVRDLLCFFNERVDLEVEGEAAERPLTQWTREDESSGNGAQSLRGLTGAKRTS
jgi:uncharacterized protein (DUF427 family)